MRDQVCLTLDVDWAPEDVLQYVVERLLRRNIRATFFATHRSSILVSLDRNRFEIGLHPDFKDFRSGFEAPIAELKAVYPDAIGGRSHGLVVSSNILQNYRAHGLRYESNIFLLRHERLHPVWRFKDMVSIPLYWSDDKHLELEEQFDLARLRLQQPGLKVLNFHPVHVFINSPDLALYERAKHNYHSSEWLKTIRNASSAGVGTLFEHLLDHFQRQVTPSLLMRDVFEQFIKQNGLRSR